MTALGRVCGRRLVVAFAVVVALASVAPAAGVARAAKRFAGIVPDVRTGASIRAPAVAHAADLPYGGGEVLHWNRTHVIFWQPTGSTLTFDPGYASLIETFLSQVADDSHMTTNVYALTGQYTDPFGTATYDSVYGGAVVATDPLPANGCTEPPQAGPGWTVCLTDQQLEDELGHVIAVDHLPQGNDDIYFLVTPDGLGDCEFAGPADCALGGDTDGSYCGYHSSTAGGVLYAVIPYNAIPGHCQSGNPRPNASTADPALSTISHEQSETITDPLGDAWIDSAQDEVGDLCITSYGTPLGATAAGAFNELIGGGRYYLQEEWSNAQFSCQPRARPDSVSFSAPRQVARDRPVSLTARAGDPNGKIVAYDWFYGDTRIGHGRRVTHAYKRAGLYRIVLRTTDSWGNWGFFARQLIVTSPVPAT